MSGKNNMKVLVTGIDGYIGTILGQTLVTEGFDVVGLDTGFYRNGWLYNGVKKVPSIITKDVRDVTIEDLKGFDAVVHLAELSNDPLGQNNPEVTYDINHDGTVHLAKTAKEAGVKRFVYYSSCSVYGASDRISDETSPTNPLTAYAKCKVLNEEALTKMADESFTPVLFRNATVYGASPRMRFDIAVNNLSGVAWTTKVIALESDGSAWRPFVHVQDVSHATVCALRAPKEAVHNQIFNVGTQSSNYTIKEIADEIKKVFTDCTIHFNNSVTDTRNYRVSFDKIAQKLPGFRPQYALKKGITELQTLFGHIALTTAMFQSSGYTRLKRIQYLKDSKQIDERFFWTKEKNNV